MKSLEQQLAERAMACVHEVVGKGYEKEYGALSHKFPYMVLANGLRLTVAFLQSKYKEEHKQFLKDLETVLGMDLNQALKQKSSTDYRVLTKRSLRASAWFKRYAQVILEVNAGDGE
ncbi:type III-B CRISPR module-associated protein Cmr5 [Paenibacillus sp. J5C_2022]|uniref:type III-B CRISPR module-associated protein Cmr5 n=1 Tax=Paenibacillus sp. J5C2022 TaxID=2977129 RepID=UPI0021CE3309|nr:type III-B CRISPR module-associated protein Cmr5 [Paenibacillus sp. J5C2022]MCU6711414.1 type III-B CRISPR module-associated protein Cmr5 [Paenibacillus sp. J5C2022]